MAYLKIHCETCGDTWEVYHRDRDANDKARQCPHCNAKIDWHVWRNEVVPALEAVHNANAALSQDHAAHHRQLFTFDVVADHLYRNRRSSGNACPLIERLNEL